MLWVTIEGRNRGQANKLKERESFCCLIRGLKLKWALLLWIAAVREWTLGELLTKFWAICWYLEKHRHKRAEVRHVVKCEQRSDAKSIRPSSILISPIRTLKSLCVCVHVCTCLLRTGCCSPSNRRRTPSYLASSPMHFPTKSKHKRQMNNYSQR